MNFKSIYDEIVENKENHDKGYYNCIPFMGLNRLESYLPGIEKATYYLNVAGTGVGKSKLTRYLFIHNPLMFLEQNPDCNIKLDILYFSLEESRKKIILAEISKYLYTKYKLVYSIKELSSVGRYNTVDPDVLLKIKEAEEHVNNFLSKVKIIDTIKNATGIYKKVRDFALTIGSYYDKNGVKFTQEECDNVTKGIGDKFKQIDTYKTDHVNHYVIIVIDHISLLQPEQGETLHQTMGKMSSNYCLHFRDKFGFTPVVVQQLAAAKETVEVNYQGKTIEEKLEPSLDALANNKEISRDANIVLGLFAPYRYKIVQHNGYDIGFIQNYYRSLSILKTNFHIFALNFNKHEIRHLYNNKYCK